MQHPPSPPPPSLLTPQVPLAAAHRKACASVPKGSTPCCEVEHQSQPAGAGAVGGCLPTADKHACDLHVTCR